VPAVTANPIPVYLPGDENRSCMGLKAEIAQLQVDMQRILKIEFDAMRQRHNRLLVYAAEKNCDMVGIRDERIPSIEERKAAAKKAKKTQKK